MTTGWNPPVLKVSAEQNTGIESVLDTIERHRAHLVASGKLDALKIRMAKLDVLEILKARLADTMKQQLDQPAVQAELEKVASKQSDPYSLADIIFEQSWRNP
jgi:LAO/AO transport system kinase